MKGTLQALLIKCEIPNNYQQLNHRNMNHTFYSQGLVLKAKHFSHQCMVDIDTFGEQHLVKYFKYSGLMKAHLYFFNLNI